jgi:hypothetical protein
LKTKNRERFEKALSKILEQEPSKEARRTIERSKETGSWLSVQPLNICGTVLSAQEFRDSLSIRYGKTPTDLPTKCDGCGNKFSVRHGMECKKGGLVIIRHNEIRDELHDLAAQAFNNSSVRDEPQIHPSRHEEQKEASEESPESQQVIRTLSKQASSEERGDILIRNLWQNGTDCILDVRITDTDAASYRHKDPKKVLEQHEREKKKKYLQACLDQRRHFSPFVVSTDGLIGREAKVILKVLASRLAEKTGKPYSELCGYVNARMSIAIVRATHLCLRGSRIPTSRMSDRRPQWEDPAGIGLYRH